MGFDAVIFDYGGVFSSSPFGRTAAAEEMLRIPHGSLSELLGYGLDVPEPATGEPYTNKWHQLEVDETSFEEYAEWVADRSEPVFGRRVEVFELISVGFGSMGIYWPMVHEARRLGEAGYRLAVCSNNIASFRAHWQAQIPIELFDVVIDSSEVGVRKPDPRIYELTAERLGVRPDRAVFLDDHPANVAGARAVGMAAVQVDDPMVAIEELRVLLSA